MSVTQSRTKTQASSRIGRSDNILIDVTRPVLAITMKKNRQCGPRRKRRPHEVTIPPLEHRSHQSHVVAAPLAPLKLARQQTARIIVQIVLSTAADALAYNTHLVAVLDFNRRNPLVPVVAVDARVLGVLRVVEEAWEGD